MLLSNFRDEQRGLSPVLEAGFLHQLALVPPTVNGNSSKKVAVDEPVRRCTRYSWLLEASRYGMMERKVGAWSALVTAT